jgi:hypothetical protein
VSTTLWQALLAVSQSPVDAGWLGIAFALGVAASFVVLRWQAYGTAAAVPVEDDELAFVEEVVGRASTLPPASESALTRESASHACAREAEEDQTRSWSRSELLRVGVVDRGPPASTVAALCLAKRSSGGVLIRSVDVAAVRRRLQHGGARE